MTETPRAYILTLIKSITDDALIAAFVRRMSGEPVTPMHVRDIRRGKL